MSCEAFLGKILLKKLLVKKSHFDYYAKKTMNYQFILSIEDTAKSLSDKNMIKKYTTEKWREYILVAGVAGRQ